jgi:hypothetical protein
MDFTDAILEFNSFKYKYDEIYTKETWKGGCVGSAVVLWIVTEYDLSHNDDLKQIHIQL